MGANSLEQRVAALEAEVDLLKNKIDEKAGEKDARPWWHKIYGSFANDPLYEEAMRLGRQYRESLRPKAKGTTKRRKKSHGHS